MINVPLSVLDAMITCGVDNVALYQQHTAAQRIARDVFRDTFGSCMCISHKDLDEYLKIYSSLPANSGQIRVHPGIRTNIKAFIQFVRDQIRLGFDPSTIPFPVQDVDRLLHRHDVHEEFRSNAKNNMEAAKPKDFKDPVKWEDWKPTFLNYLRTIPGRNGVPLKYICRENDAPNPLPNRNFLDDYIAMAPLHGEAYDMDTVLVHTYLQNFILGNDNAEAKIRSLTNPEDGREAFKRLCEHYEGVGIHAIDIREAEEVLENLYYTGEKQPYMWWAEFEKRLTRAFNAYNKHERREVFSDAMKIRKLLRLMKADFLDAVTAQLNIELQRVPMTVTYDQAIALYRNAVNAKYPPTVVAANNRTRRNVNEVNSGRGTRGGGGRGGSGRGGRGNRGRGRGRGGKNV